MSSQALPSYAAVEAGETAVAVYAPGATWTAPATAVSAPGAVTAAPGEDSADRAIT